MKILFCSPYLDSDLVAKGGINTWGRYIMSYYDTLQQNDIVLLPVSFDRQSSKKTGEKNILSRIWSGIKEYRRPVKEILRSIKQDKPQVIHLCTSGGLGLLRDLFVLFVAKKSKIKTILHLHYGRIPELIECNNWEWKLLDRAIRLCDIPVVMNIASEKALIGIGYTKVKNIPNPVGSQTMNLIKSRAGKLKLHNRRLLYCGHVIKSKGVFELVEACSTIPDIHLRIVGRYSQDIKSEMISIATKSCRDISWLDFVGEVSHEKVIDEFYQADIFVFPSYTEGFPNVILEAMACGCPIISTFVGAIPEMLNFHDDPCGICVSPRSSIGVHDAILSLIDAKELKDTYRNKALIRVNTLYTIEQVWNNLINIWKI